MLPPQDPEELIALRRAVLTETLHWFTIGALEPRAGNFYVDPSLRMENTPLKTLTLAQKKSRSLCYVCIAGGLLFSWIKRTNVDAAVSTVYLHAWGWRELVEAMQGVFTGPQLEVMEAAFERHISQHCEAPYEEVAMASEYFVGLEEMEDTPFTDKERFRLIIEKALEDPECLFRP